MTNAQQNNSQSCFSHIDDHPISSFGEWRVETLHAARQSLWHRWSGALFPANRYATTAKAKTLRKETAELVKESRRRRGEVKSLREKVQARFVEMMKKLRLRRAG
jgi:hypothetical protein